MKYSILVILVSVLSITLAAQSLFPAQAEPEIKGRSATFYYNFSLNYVNSSQTMDSIWVVPSSQLPGSHSIILHSKSANFSGIGAGINGSLNWIIFSSAQFSAMEKHSWAVSAGVPFTYNQNYMNYSTKALLRSDVLSREGRASSMKVMNDVKNTDFHIGVAIESSIALGAIDLHRRKIGSVLGITWRPEYQLINDKLTTKYDLNTPNISAEHTIKTENTSHAGINLGTFECSLDLGKLSSHPVYKIPGHTVRISALYSSPNGKYDLSSWMLGVGIGGFLNR